jgi:2-dehydro-3-deoxygluconokinase
LLLRLSPPGEERLLDSPQLVTCFGGAEANVAVALTHLGVRCDYVTRLPESPIGDAALVALRREGVGIDRVLRGGDRMGIYFVEPGADLRTMRVVYDRTGSAFAGMDRHALDWPALLEGADWFHATGITPALGDGPRTALTDAIACARARGTRTSFDLNYREVLWRGRDPRPVIEPLVRQVDVVLGNAAAVQAMLGGDSDDASLPARVADRFGARLVALTRRELLGSRRQAWSAVLYDAGNGRLATSRRHELFVVDRVGGGDCFAAGLIAKVLGGAAPGEALEFAVAAGALKLTIPGDFGRASVADVEAWLRQ